MFDTYINSHREHSLIYPNVDPVSGFLVSGVSVQVSRFRGSGLWILVLLLVREFSRLVNWSNGQIV